MTNPLCISVEACICLEVFGFTITYIYIYIYIALHICDFSLTLLGIIRATAMTSTFRTKHTGGLRERYFASPIDFSPSTFSCCYGGMIRMHAGLDRRTQRRKKQYKLQKIHPIRRFCCGCSIYFPCLFSCECAHGMTPSSLTKKMRLVAVLCLRCLSGSFEANGTSLSPTVQIVLKLTGSL